MPNSSLDSAWIAVQHSETIVTVRNQLSRIIDTEHAGTLSPMHKRLKFFGCTTRPLKSYVASKSHLKLAARTVLSVDAGLLVITANMQSETGFPSSHQLKFYVAFKSRLKLAVHAVLSADAGLLVLFSKVVAAVILDI